jgi:hypothetical protein
MEQWACGHELKITCRVSDRFPIAAFARKRGQSKIQVVSMGMDKIRAEFSAAKKI